MLNKIFQSKIQSGQGNNRVISRNDFLKQIALVTGFIMTSCTPVKILLNSHDDKYDKDAYLKKKILEAFVTTVIPGADTNNPNLCTIFYDEYYPFYKYCGFFISDLCNKSKKMFGTECFYDLSLAERTEVIQAGLDDDSTTEKIYTAAIFISQVSVYCSIYDDERGCSLIEFPGSYAFIDTEMYYSDNYNYLAAELTSTGNYC